MYCKDKTLVSHLHWFNHSNSGLVANNLEIGYTRIKPDIQNITVSDVSHGHMDIS
jgi:hypothetical protein